MRTLLLSTLVLFVLTSCNTKQDGITLIGSTGAMNRVTIIVDNNLWKGVVGDSIREIIAKPVLGLPQEETQFNITQASPKAFGNLFRNNRNLLFIGIETKEGYGVKNNIYAQPQTVMTIVGTDKKTLLKEISEHKEDIISVFKTAELKFYQNRITKDHWDIKKIKTLTHFGIDMKIPKSYGLVDDTGNFMWFRQNIETGSMNIIAYSIPLSDNDTIAKKIVAARDSIGKKYIPGQFEGTYMATEDAYTPFTKKVTISGLSAYETRGMWVVKGDYMAGPFLNYTVIDKKNNRFIVVEGFTYAPSINKRDYMFELEAILKTLKI